MVFYFYLEIFFSKFIFVWKFKKFNKKKNHFLKNISLFTFNIICKFCIQANPFNPGGTLTILFSKKSPWEFEKNPKGPPMKMKKKFEIFFLIFFCPRWSLGPSKIYLRSFFEKSQHKFESLVFLSGEFWNIHPLFYRQDTCIFPNLF